MISALFPSTTTASGLPYAPNDTGSVCIAWIDVSSLTRECMTQAIGSAQRLFVIVPFESVYDCLKAQDRTFDLIVYHAHETNSVNIADVAALRQAFASAQLVVLSDAISLEPAVVKDVLMKGASGFILTSQTGLQMMLSALALVASGGTFVPKDFLLFQDNPEPQATKEQPRQAGQLTTRELDVLRLVKQGKANKVIAYELNLSESTVKVHMRNTMRKMGSTNRTHVAMNADRYIDGRAA
jgi:DNA-binding NarL/FixJ family response regulator